MESPNKYCNVKNRSASVVVYSIADSGIRRSFAPGEVKKVSYEELEKLTYQRGGMEILTRFLQVQSEDALHTFNMRVEPEYHMSEQDIARVMTTGTLDEFLDMLDFAPNGVIDLVKRMAVNPKNPLQDYSKIEALKKKTGLDVAAALKNIRAEQEEKKSIDDSGEVKRRVQKETPTATATRRTAPKYNVVSKEEKAAE